MLIPNAHPLIFVLENLRRALARNFLWLILGFALLYWQSSHLSVAPKYLRMLIMLLECRNWKIFSNEVKIWRSTYRILSEVCDTPILLDRNEPRFTLALCVGFAYEQFTVESLKVYKGLQRFTDCKSSCRNLLCREAKPRM